MRKVTERSELTRTNELEVILTSNFASLRYLLLFLVALVDRILQNICC